VSTSRERKKTSHSLSEGLLLFLSRKPGTADYETGRDHWAVDNALSQLCRAFPNFLPRVAGKEILDFGCGVGYQTVALARMGAKHVIGLDSNRALLETGRELARYLHVTDKIEFVDTFEHRLKGSSDLIISQNSMEHFPEPVQVLEQMKSALKPNGKILITFGPPWFAPYGSHMHFFTKVPWVNLLFAEETVMKVRARFRDDGARRYEEVESGLNKMTVAKFERTLSTAGLLIEHRRYDCVKRLNILHKLPFVRELFVNEISCVLASR
jgi:SAM-dependent methyltransferase